MSWKDSNVMESVGIVMEKDSIVLKRQYCHRKTNIMESNSIVMEKL